MSRLRAFWRQPGRADAEAPLRAWYKATEQARDWRSIRDVRQTFGSADGVPLKCGITATVFNIGGNKYRLVTIVKYELHLVLVQFVLTHREYDTNRWKDRICER